MNLILKEIAVNRKVFIMLFIGFTLTILPILIAMSIRDYYDEKFYEYKMVILNITILFSLLALGNWISKQFKR